MRWFGSEVGEQGPEAVARAFRDGDSRATRDVRERVRRILRFRRLRIAVDERRDLEQVIVIQLWEAVKRPEFDGVGFWGFVETVSARRAIDWLRTRRDEVDVEALAEASDPAPSPLGRVLDRERRDRLESCLDQLPAGCKELVRLHFVEGKPYAEIAALLGRREGALRVQMHRCVRRAGELLRSPQSTEPSNL